MAGLSFGWKKKLLLLCAVGVVIIARAVEGGDGRGCPPCGRWEVPYPLSTSPTCGHPLYSITCTPNKQLQVDALSGKYIVKSINARNRSLVIWTAPFLRDTCITLDSISAHNFSLYPTLPFSVAPDNTVLLLNASEMLKYSPLKCGAMGVCPKVLPYLSQRSCRKLFCCSFSTEALVFKHGFPNYGQESGYASVINIPQSLDGQVDWRPDFGLRVQWDSPSEPPCKVQEDCGENSTCTSITISPPPVPTPPGAKLQPSSPAPNPHTVKVCLCDKGHIFDRSDGTCPRAPYCVRNSGSVECNKVQYVAGLTVGITSMLAFTILMVCFLKRRRRAKVAHAKLVKERSLMLANNSGGKSARLFSKHEMKRATNNFARDRVLGCGGFGEVYKGELDDKTVVAIKSAKIGNIKGIDQVLNEVRVLSQVNHRSLVRLLGCCVESDLPLMVYEYVPCPMGTYMTICKTKAIRSTGGLVCE